MHHGEMTYDDGVLRRVYDEGYRAGFREAQAKAGAAGGQGPLAGSREWPAGAPAEGATGWGAPAAENQWQAQYCLTPEELAAKKLLSVNRSLNGILYMASFLLVAAGAALLAGSLPDSAKLLGVWALAAVFYGAGLVVYATVKRLQPAASAFVGTGLALIPFGGIALGAYTTLSGRVAWLVTSVVGLLALTGALWRLRHAAFGYLWVLSVFSLAAAASVSLDLSLRWMLLAMVVTAASAGLVASLRPAPASHPDPGGGRTLRPQPLMAELARSVRRPAELASWVVSPLATLFAVAAAIRGGSPLDLILVGVAATLQYGVEWFGSGHPGRLFGLRVLAHMTAVGLIAEWVPSGLSRGIAVILTGAVQHMASTLVLAVPAPWVVSQPVTACQPGYKNEALSWRLTEYSFAALSVLIMVVVSVAAADISRPYPVILVGLATVIATNGLAAFWLQNPVYAMVAGAATCLVPNQAAWTATTLGSWWPAPLLHLLMAFVVIALVRAFPRRFGPWWTPVAGLVGGTHLVVATLWRVSSAPAVSDIAVPLLVIPLGMVLASGLGRRFVQPLVALSLATALYRVGLHADLPNQWTALLACLPTLAMVIGWAHWDCRLTGNGGRAAMASGVATFLAAALASSHTTLIAASSYVIQAGLLGAFFGLGMVWWKTTNQLTRIVAGVSTVVVGTVAIVAAFYALDDQARLVTCGIVTLLAWAAAAEGGRTARIVGVVGAVLAQPMGALSLDPPWSVVASHIAAAVLAAAILLRRDRPELRIAGVLAIPTMVVGLVALERSGTYALIFLVEQIAILVLGTLWSRPWARWWGTVTTTLGVLYFLRDYLFIELGLLALLLIVLVVWRLLQPGTGTQNNPQRHEAPAESYQWNGPPPTT